MLSDVSRYIALLRGVNVGGRTIRSAELAEAFRSLGYGAVKTVLASGNVVFDAEGEAPALRAAIEKALGETFGYDARVQVLGSDALSAIVDAYPFVARDGWHRYVVFLIGADGAASAPRDAELDAVAAHALELTLDPELERLADGGPVIYWTVERGRTLDSVVGKALGSARMKEHTTNRNLNTLLRLL